MNFEDKVEIEALTPMEELDSRNPGFKVYRDVLTSAFENPMIRNLALSGSLGSGKSSIIRSFDRYRGKDRKRFLYVSLIDFSKAVTDAEGTKYDQRQLEHSLLTQILSYCKSDDLPEGFDGDFSGFGAPPENGQGGGFGSPPEDGWSFPGFGSSQT